MKGGIAFALILLLGGAGVDSQEARASVGGRTLDESGSSIPGAFVTLRPSGPRAGAIELEVLSDESGGFRFNGLAPGGYRVAAHLVGSYPAVSTIEVPAARDVAVSLVLTQAPLAKCLPTFTRAIAFKTRTGEPLPTAYLTVMRDGRRTQSYDLLPTGGAGPCFSPTAADSVTLDVLGYGEHMLKRAGQDPGKLVWVRAIEPTPASIAGRTKPGEPQGQVRGRVFDVYGASIPDASIQFTPVDARSGLSPFGAVADARGRFDFEGVRTGTYHVTCRALGYETSVAVHEVRPGVQTEVTMVVRSVR